MALRPYQEHDLAEIRQAYDEGKTRVLLVQPTGAGKGFLCAYMVKTAVSRGYRIMFWVNRRTLVFDMSKRLDALGVDHGIIMAGTKRNRPHLGVQVVSIETLRGRSHLPAADFIVVDEAHFAVTDGFRDMIARYPDANFLFMTATPIRLSGEGLGVIAEVMVHGPSVQFLIDQKFLVPSKVYGFRPPDLRGVNVGKNGDYNEKQLSDKIDTNVFVGDVVREWKKHASDRKTVFFGIDKKHARRVCDKFLEAGVKAECVVDDTSDEERERIWEALDHGDLQVVTSVGVISYGWDHPIVSCVILGRPTAAVSLHLQQIGRGARPYPGKTNLLILDHVGNHARHGFYEDPRQWTLEGGLVKKAADKVTGVATCLKCYLTFQSGPDFCPSCGAPIPKDSRGLKSIAGELAELQRAQKAAAIDEWRENAQVELKRAKFLELRREARDRGFKRGYPMAKFMAMFKCEPDSSWWKEAI